MVEFIQKNQINDSISYKGVSGRRYISYQGRPFKVEDKEDIAYFDKNKRFERHGVFKKAKKKIQESIDKVKGEVEESDDDIDRKAFNSYFRHCGEVPEADFDKLVSVYGSPKPLVKDVASGARLIGHLSPEGAKVVENYIKDGGPYPRHSGGGWYELSNGSKVQGKDEAESLQKNLEE